MKISPEAIRSHSLKGTHSSASLQHPALSSRTLHFSPMGASGFGVTDFSIEISENLCRNFSRLFSQWSFIFLKENADVIHTKSHYQKINFSFKHPDTVSHSILLEELASCGLDRYSLAGKGTGWRARHQEWWWMELNPAGDQSSLVFPRGWCWGLSCSVSL